MSFWKTGVLSAMFLLIVLTLQRSSAARLETRSRSLSPTKNGHAAYNHWTTSPEFAKPRTKVSKLIREMPTSEYRLSENTINMDLTAANLLAKLLPRVNKAKMPIYHHDSPRILRDSEDHSASYLTFNCHVDLYSEFSEFSRIRGPCHVIQET